MKTPLSDPGDSSIRFPTIDVLYFFFPLKNPAKVVVYYYYFIGSKIEDEVRVFTCSKFIFQDFYFFQKFMISVHISNYEAKNLEKNKNTEFANLSLVIPKHLTYYF